MTLSEAEYEFDVECPICGTRQEGTSAQIGQRIACPDCHSQVLVQEPPLRQRRPRGMPLPAADEELRLSEPVAADPRRAIVQGMLDSAAESWPRKGRPRTWWRRWLARRFSARRRNSRPTKRAVRRYPPNR